MDACAAPILSVTLGRLAMSNYLFSGTADGNLIYYKLSDGNGDAMSMDEEVAERRIKTMGVHQYTFQHGRVIRVGSSITHMEFGCFNGAGASEAECLYIWSERSLVLLQDFHAVVLHCSSHATVPKSTKLHTEKHPHGLVGATMDGNVLCGHVDLSSKLRWQVLKVEGTAVRLAHHRSSGCIAFISIDGNSCSLHLAHEVSMLQLLIVELECNHFPKVLSSLHLPYTMYSQSGESVECLVVATQAKDDDQGKTATGLLHFFDVHVSYASDNEVKYELRMLGLHSSEQPCHSICMVDAAPASSTLSNCAMCNLGPLQVTDDAKLMDILLTLEHASKHWSRCCNDRSSSDKPLDDHVPRAGALMALGFKGKVEVLYVFVGASEACMLVVPSIAAALDAPFLPLAGIYEDHSELDVEEKQLTEDLVEEEEEEEGGMQPSPAPTAQSCGLDAKWTTSSRINIKKLVSFSTPGEGCVTALVSLPTKLGTILVVEKLHGLSVFEITAESSEVVKLAWQPCSYPLEAVIPLSDDLYMLSMHGNGCQVMERDYPAEAANQTQEKLRKDLENELMIVQDQVQDGTPRSTIISELQQRSSMERLPRLKHVAAAASWTASVFQLSSGSLLLESMPLTRTPTTSELVNQPIAAVTPTGEVGICTVSSRYLSEN